MRNGTSEGRTETLKAVQRSKERASGEFRGIENLRSERGGLARKRNGRDKSFPDSSERNSGPRLEVAASTLEKGVAIAICRRSDLTTDTESRNGTETE